MPKPAKAVMMTLRQLEYRVLLPFVFCATYIEAAPPSTREAFARGVVSVAMMIAGLTGVNIIRAMFE